MQISYHPCTNLHLHHFPLRKLTRTSPDSMPTHLDMPLIPTYPAIFLDINHSVTSLLSHFHLLSGLPTTANVVQNQQVLPVLSPQSTKKSQGPVFVCFATLITLVTVYSRQVPSVVLHPTFQLDCVLQDPARILQPMQRTWEIRTLPTTGLFLVASFPAETLFDNRISVQNLL